MGDMTISEIFDLIGKVAVMLFTLAQWHILVMIVIATSVAVHHTKRMFPHHTNTKRKIYIMSFISGLCVTGIAYLVAEAQQPLWFWLIAGTLAGSVSNFIYWATMPFLRKYVPWLFPSRKQP